MELFSTKSEWKGGWVGAPAGCLEFLCVYMCVHACMPVYTSVCGHEFETSLSKIVGLFLNKNTDSKDGGF